MQPILELRKAGSDMFTYSLSATVRSTFPRHHELFSSTERCLYDAGKALQNYFDSVHIRYDGISLGAYPVSRLVVDPLGLFQELMEGLIDNFRARNRMQRAAPARAAAATTAPAPLE